MANPVTVQCIENTWTLVAENVTSGFIRKLNKAPRIYLSTYRTTGGAVPTDRAEGVPIFEIGSTEEITSAAGIDVYVMAIGADGEIRRDIS